jgi:hypothetical protein
MTVVSVVFNGKANVPGRWGHAHVCSRPLADKFVQQRVEASQGPPGSVSGSDIGARQWVPMPSAALLVYLNLPDSIALTWLLHTARRFSDCAVGIFLALVVRKQGIDSYGRTSF